MQNESEHQFLQRIFIEVFRCKTSGYKEGKGEELQGKPFSSSIMPMGGMQFHWFKLIPSFIRRELKNLVLKLLGPATFFTSIECKPLHGKRHLLGDHFVSGQ